MRAAVFAAAVSLLLPFAADAVVLSFDDFPDSTQFASYQGYNFSLFITQDTSEVPLSGYAVDLVSPRNVAYNNSGRAASISAATPFSLTSGYLAGAWNDGLTVSLTGTLNGASVYTQSFIVDATHKTFAVFNPLLVDKVIFASSGGVHHAAYVAGTGTQFALDDLTINGTVGGGIVPEPATWAMLAGGFVLVGGVIRTRRRRPLATTAA